MGEGSTSGWSQFHQKQNKGWISLLFRFHGGDFCSNPVFRDFIYQGSIITLAGSKIDCSTMYFYEKSIICKAILVHVG
jgi:hypothetical protein